MYFELMRNLLNKFRICISINICISIYGMIVYNILQPKD